MDVYQGLRVLESGLEPGQKVIVEGIQLVRPDQVVKPVDVPLETFIRTETSNVGGDRRFNSRVSRIPGRESEPNPQPPSPATKGPAPDSKTQLDRQQ